jgi:hypothetical protein
MTPPLNIRIVSRDDLDSPNSGMPADVAAEWRAHGSGFLIQHGRGNERGVINYVDTVEELGSALYAILRHSGNPRVEVERFGEQAIAAYDSFVIPLSARVGVN